MELIDITEYVKSFEVEYKTELSVNEGFYFPNPKPVDLIALIDDVFDILSTKADVLINTKREKWYKPSYSFIGELIKIDNKNELTIELKEVNITYNNSWLAKIARWFVTLADFIKRK